jgi:6-phosphogluconolactonase
MNDRTIRTAYIGGYAGTDTPMKGITHARIDADGQRWEVAGSHTDIPNPFHLARSPRGDVLYAASNVADGAIHALRVEPDGSLVSLGEQPTKGAGTVHSAVDPSGRHLVVANHDSGNVVVHDLDAEGRIGPVRSSVEHTGAGPNPFAQAGPHPHEVVFDPISGHVLVPDKGTDSIWVHSFADGELAAGEQLPLPEGTGPRQLVLHPDGHHAYVVGELNSTVTVLSRHPATGALTVQNTVSTLPADVAVWNGPSAARISADGTALYVGNRGHESIAIFAVEGGGGALRLVAAPRVTEAEGVTTLPWDIVLDHAAGPGVLHVANQLAGAVVTFLVDAAAGTITPVGQPLTAPSPACITLF